MGSLYFLKLFSNGLGDSTMESRHGKEMEISNGNPRAVLLSATDVAKIDVEGEFEMGIRVLECSDRITYFRNPPKSILKLILKESLGVITVVWFPVREFP